VLQRGYNKLPKMFMGIETIGSTGYEKYRHDGPCQGQNHFFRIQCHIIDLDAFFLLFDPCIGPIIGISVGIGVGISLVFLEIG
jgi:hypothetical protein